jgi:hypothetical protein
MRRGIDEQNQNTGDVIKKFDEEILSQCGCEKVQHDTCLHECDGVVVENSNVCFSGGSSFE